MVGEQNSKNKNSSDKTGTDTKMLQLLAVNTECKGLVIPLADNKYSVGRSGKSDIMLDDATVSKNHCVITKEKTLYKIKDNKSMNGVYINNILVEEYELNANDMLRVGKFIFKIITKTN
jgi:pSer/pThr/pTyr-binding forkhead associated (FHA) protein